MGEQSRMHKTAAIQEKRPQFFSVSRFFCISLMDDQQQKAKAPTPSGGTTTATPAHAQTAQSNPKEEKSPRKAIRAQLTWNPLKQQAHAESEMKNKKTHQNFPL